MAGSRLDDRSLPGGGPRRYWAWMTRGPFSALSPLQAVLLAAAVGAAVTLISLAPMTSVAYRSVTLHVAIETAATFVALLAGVLMLGRFMRTPVLPDLLLAAALLTLGLTNLFFAVVPWIADEQPGSFDTWAPIAGRILGAVGFVLGAILPATRVAKPRRAIAHALAGVVGMLVVVGLLVAVLAPHLPVGVDPDLPPDPSGPDLVGDPSLLASQVVSLLLYAVAAAGFARRATRTGDELMVWLAAASMLAAFSRLNYFLFPSLYSEWVYAGDFLRIAFYLLILAGALREIAGYQHDLAEVAVHRERRRIARDLHDGLAQELTYIGMQARRLRVSDNDPASFIARAAERALGESRHAIATLARPVNGPLATSIAIAAEEVAGREGIELELDLEPELEAPDPVHDALTRIVREAVTNAIRHGGARCVRIRLDHAGELCLTIDDDGRGFGSERAEGAGFGLISMRERAETLGGSCRLSESPLSGVRIEVRVP